MSTTHRAHAHHARRWVRRPAVTVVGVLVAALLGAGLASAAWVSTGGGTATGRAGQALPPTTTAVAGSAITANLLYPGSSGDVKLTVTNPNPYRVAVTSVAGAGTVAASGGTGTCSTTGVALTTTSPGTAIAAGATTTLTLTGAATMSTASDSGCQNATFTLPVSVSVTSS